MAGRTAVNHACGRVQTLLCLREIPWRRNNDIPTDTRWTCYGRMLCGSLVRRTLSRQTIVPSSSNNAYSLLREAVAAGPACAFQPWPRLHLGPNLAEPIY